MVVLEWCSHIARGCIILICKDHTQKDADLKIGFHAKPDLQIGVSYEN